MSQSVTALLRLRELIFSGELLPGERLSENGIADRLGASRTPVRAALARLAEEGLLSRIPSGGFAVRAFTEHEIRDAIEVRGTLEGLAARFIAERGTTREMLARLRAAVAGIDEILVYGNGGAFDMPRYVASNAQFHDALREASDSAVLIRELEQLMLLPFASPSAFLYLRDAQPEFRTILTVAQEQHRGVLDAIELRQGTRAEALMREHARLAHRHLTLALRNEETLRLLPEGAVIHLRRRA